MKNWDKFNEQQKPEEKPEGKAIGGMYRCQFCGSFAFEGTYFPNDSILKYKCPDGHTNFVEDFRVAF